MREVSRLLCQMLVEMQHQSFNPSEAKMATGRIFLRVPGTSTQRVNTSGLATDLANAVASAAQSAQATQELVQTATPKSVESSGRLNMAAILNTEPANAATTQEFPQEPFAVEFQPFATETEPQAPEQAQETNLPDAITLVDSEYSDEGPTAVIGLYAQKCLSCSEFNPGLGDEATDYSAQCSWRLRDNKLCPARRCVIHVVGPKMKYISRIQEAQRAGDMVRVAALMARLHATNKPELIEAVMAAIMK